MSVALYSWFTWKCFLNPNFFIFQTKDNKVTTLSDAYKDSPEMKVAILQACKANVQRILDKNLHDSE